MTIAERLQKSVSKNPIAWLLAAFLVAAVYGNYTLGKRLTRICELTVSVVDLRVDDAGLTTSTNLEALVARIERLETEESLEGRVWRWQTYEGAQIEDMCAEREAYPSDDY